MSHVSAVGIEVKDLSCLRKAASKLGLVFKEDQKTYRWFGKWVDDYHGSDAAYKNGIFPDQYGHCAHAIGIPNNPLAYEIGVVPFGDGFKLIYDFYGPGQSLIAIAGKDLCELAKGYASEVAIHELMGVASLDATQIGTRL